MPYRGRVRTVRSAAFLLSTASSIDRLKPILSGLGFETDAPPTDATTRATLRIPPDFRDVTMAIAQKVDCDAFCRSACRQAHRRLAALGRVS